MAKRAHARHLPIQELANLQVINRHTYDGPRDASYLYIGRGTPLGNNWSHVNGTAAQFQVATRLDAISEYRQWLWQEIQSGKGAAFNALEQIKDRVVSGEKVNLACSCHPEPCHGDVVKGAVEHLIQRDREKELQQAPQQPQPAVAQTTPLQQPAVPAPKLSARAEQAHRDILSQGASDDYRTIFNVEEGLTRGEHAHRLNQTDQFLRESYERGATISDSILSIPKDPDAKPLDATKVTIGTEAHAIDFVRGFVDDPKLAVEKGQRLFEVANQACGQWMDSHGRLTVFTNVYDQVRRDENGAFRGKEGRAASIDRVIEETGRWAEQLPQPTPEPTADEVHQYTLDLAEENRSAAFREPELEEQIQLQPGADRDPHLLYLQELNANSHGLASIGELTGFSTPDLLPEPIADENQIYADIFEQGADESLEFATPEGDHLGAERQQGDGRALDATFDRINLDSLPPPIPATLTSQTEQSLITEILPRIDAQIESGLSKREILSPIYDANRTNETNRFDERLANLFQQDLPDQAAGTSVRVEKLNALSSLRLLVAAEYKRETKHFTREAVQWAKDNYYQNPDRLRAAGKLQVGEYQKIITAQAEGRTAWLTAHPGQQAPTRSQIARINSLEIAGYKINDRLETLAPTKVELLQTLDRVQSRLGSATLNTENLLRDYERAEACSQHLTNAASQFADHVRDSDAFQTLKSTFLHNEHERGLDERQALVRGNNPSFEYRAGPFHAEVVAENQYERAEERSQLTRALISPDIQAAQLENARELESHARYFTQITGREISTAAEARQGMQPTLDGLHRTSDIADATRTRLDPNIAPQLDLQSKVEPVFVSLTSNEVVRMPVATMPEYEAIAAAVEDCRLQTAVWTTLHSPLQITGRDEEREETTHFLSQYIDYRHSDHTTNQLARNPVFRDYAQRLSDTRTTDELVQTAIEIRTENFQTYNQLQAHLANPTEVESPGHNPLSVSEMRELFLSVSPQADNREMRDGMRAALHSMTVFGKEKAERVQLLAEGKIKPSPGLARLLENLDTRNTKGALNHFYMSLRNPADTLTRPNTFDLYKTHRGLPQYERDYLQQHALAAKYESLNPTVPTQTNENRAAAQTLPIEEKLPTPAETGFYREYYARADLLEARGTAAAQAVRDGHPYESLNNSTVVAELTDLDVRTISQVVNHFDEGRQSQIVDHLRQSTDERQQAFGDLIKIAGDVQAASINHDVTVFNLDIPEQYPISGSSLNQVVSYVQQDARAASNNPLSPERTAALRESAQREAWQEMKASVFQSPDDLLNAPASLAYETRDLQQSIEQSAGLQDRARTAFQVLENHVASCTTRAGEALSRYQVSSQANITGAAIRSPDEQRDFNRELVNAALNPDSQSGKALTQTNPREFQVVQQSLTASNIDLAAQLREYAGTARADYLQSFVRLDNDKTTLQTTEARVIEPQAPTLGSTTQQSAAERYVATRDDIEHSVLTDHAHEMIETGTLPDISRGDIQNLTIRDLIPQDVRDNAQAQARELAWQSFEPQELKDATAGRNVDERLVNAADKVMDRVATAQTLEQQLDTSRDNLKTFVDNQIARAEQPVREERAAAAYETQFRDVLRDAREEARLPIDNEAHESTKLLDALNNGSTPATLVAQAESQQLTSIEQDLVTDAHNSATIEAQIISEKSLYVSRDERDAAHQQILTELNGQDAARHNELRASIEQLETRFEQSFHSIDDKFSELADTRMDVRIEKELSQFREIAKPAAAAINNYLKDTVREEGFKSLFEPLRHDDHVERISQAIIESATANNISLDHSAAGLDQISDIAGNLFDTLSLNLEHLNQQVHTQAISHDLNASALLDQSRMLTLAGNNPALGSSPNGNLRDVMSMLDPHHNQHQHLPGQDPTQLNERDSLLIGQSQALDPIAAVQESALNTHAGAAAAELTVEPIAEVLAL